MVSPQILDVLANLANGSFSPRTTAGAVPSKSALQSALTTTPSNWPTFVGDYINHTIKPIFQDSNVSPLIGKFIRTPSDFPGFTPTAPIDLPKTADCQDEPLAPKVDFLEYKLAGSRVKAGALDHDIQRGQKVASDFIQNNSLPSMTIQDDAIALINDLRAFEGYLTRISAAQKAAQATGQTLPKALALYRTEGDLLVPSSRGSMDPSLALPTIEQNFNYRLALVVKPNLSNGVWMMERQAFLNLVPNAVDDWIKVEALGVWMDAILGFDAFRKALFSIQSRNFDAAKTQFAKISGVVWQAAGFDGSQDMAKKRFQDLFDNLDLKTIPLASVVLTVAPIDPIKFVSMVLTEGLMFMQGTLNFRPVKAIDALGYLAFNAQHKYSTDDPSKDLYSQIILSALVTAKKTNDQAFSSLKASLAPIAFPAALKKRADYKQAFDNLDTAGWFNDQTHVNDLVNFISAAGQNTWSYYFCNRANFSRFNYVLSYYNQLAT